MPNCVSTPIAGYWSKTPSRSGPDFFLSEADAHYLCQRAQAYPFGRHGRKLRMISSDACLAPGPLVSAARDASCRMGENIIFANAAGSTHAAALTQGWIANRAGLAPRADPIPPRHRTLQSPLQSSAENVRGEVSGGAPAKPSSSCAGNRPHWRRRHAFAGAAPAPTPAPSIEPNQPPPADSVAESASAAGASSPAGGDDTGSGGEPGDALPFGSRVAHLSMIGCTDHEIGCILGINPCLIKKIFPNELSEGWGRHLEIVHHAAFEAAQRGNITALGWLWKRLGLLMR